MQIPNILFNIRAGVPQGSILGPLLFIIHVNDQSRLMNSSYKAVPFAYDTSIVIKSNECDVEQTANKKLKCVLNWISV